MGLFHLGSSMNGTVFRAALFGALFTLASVSAASALDRRVRIYNDTSYTINEFYASNVGTRNWEEDILGEDVLPPGYSVVVNIDDSSGYCKFDFLAVFEDGDEVQSNTSVNVCEVGDFHFTE